MGRYGILALVFSVVLVSCVGGDGGGSDPATATTTTTTPTATTTNAPLDPGRLVILDETGNIVVLDPDGTNEDVITEDAGASAAYAQPLWSPDGRALAWGEVRDSGFAVGIHTFDSDELVSVPTTNLPFYLSWSPGGEQIGVLHNGPAGIDFNLVDVARSRISRVGTGAPYYFSWSPAGDILVTHVGADRVETIDSAGESTALEPTGPFYLAPQWTDAGVFHVADDELVVESDNGTRAEVANVSGLTMFVSNPQGTRVALQATGDGDALEVALTETPTVPSGTVSVIDVEAGTVDSVADDLAVGFFWSTTGESLLALVPDETGNVVPKVWTTGDGVEDYPSYRPSAAMLRDTFPFFPQYAQSVNFWAPDGSAFAYAGVVDGDEGIWVQPLTGAPRVRVSAGRWVAWSLPG
jgi:TolB protein